MPSSWGVVLSLTHQHLLFTLNLLPLPAFLFLSLPSFWERVSCTPDDLKLKTLWSSLHKGWGSRCVPHWFALCDCYSLGLEFFIHSEAASLPVWVLYFAAHMVPVPSCSLWTKPVFWDMATLMSICLSTYLSIYPSIYINIYLYINIYRYMHTNIHIPIYVSIHLSIYINTYLYINTYRSIYKYIRTHAYINVLSIHLDIPTYIPIYQYTYIYI